MKERESLHSQIEHLPIKAKKKDLIEEEELQKVTQELSEEATVLRSEKDQEKRGEYFRGKIKKLFKRRITKAMAALLVSLGAAAHHRWPRETEVGALATPGIHELYEALVLSPEEKVLAINIRDHLGELAGNYALSEIEFAESIKDPEERKAILEKEQPNIQVSGFEQAKECGITVSNEEIAEVFMKSLPKGVGLNVKTISYNPQSRTKGEGNIVEKIFEDNEGLLANRGIFAQADISEKSIEVFKKCGPHELPPFLGAYPRGASLERLAWKRIVNSKRAYEVVNQGT